MTKRFEFTPATKAAIRAKGDCCWACGVPGWIGIEVDHIIPRKNADGTPNINCNNSESNGQMLCSNCNNVKSTVTFAVAPRKPYWNGDQVAMMQQVTANRHKFATLIRRARARQ
jgi:5-methylcytosine-specific restriction endonuclease McrA